ncbi:MAG TPA: hypothetical protein VFB38_01300 [Chthonomonadaceae bacterium]|nr:hypothetical protein [Chthonomonadaceae bacterium]
MASEAEAREVKRRHAAQLLSKPGVVGVGVEQDPTGQYVLAIYLNTDDPEIRRDLPQQIEGCPVKLVRSGPFRKFPAAEEG